MMENIEEMESSFSPPKKLKVSVGSNKFRILCLHGYRQNGNIFRQKTGALRKLLKPYAEFVFLTAPMKVPPIATDESQSSAEASNVDQYGWWFSDENCGFNSKKPSEVCIGFTKSLELITEVFGEQGPFDGLLGFSQGASFVSVLCGMLQRKILPFRFRFAIIISGFKSLCSPHFKNYLEIMNIPSLHVFGETDEVIPGEMSEDLASYFKNPVKLLHPGGHYVPASDPVKQGYISFIKDGIWEIISDDDSEHELETNYSETNSMSGEEA